MTRTKLVVFHCPKTGKLVPHFIAEHPNEDDIHRFDAVECAACGTFHLINRATGEAPAQTDT